MHIARRFVRERTSMLRALAALAVLCAFGAASANAKSGGITVSTSASISGSVVQGTVVITNTTTQSMVISALNDALEVRYATGSPLPSLPAGSSSGYYVVAALSLSPPGAVPALGWARKAAVGGLLARASTPAVAGLDVPPALSVLTTLAVYFPADT